MQTESLIFLFFRRMRVPLVVLISAYAIATVGFTLIPGLDDQGNPWRMSLFQAFYVVSYTGTTIGFGEVPYDFSEAQRLWTMVSIYLTVIAWLFSIGSIVSLLQDPVYLRALRRARLVRSIRSLNRGFYLVCGYGDTGRVLVRALAARGHPVVVIDHNRDKIEGLEVEDLGASVTAFAMDARTPDNLVLAGLRHRWCAAVIAVTGDARANLRIAIAARLLNHSATVHARADTQAVAENLRSFSTDHVINPVDEFARRFDLAIARPDLFRLYHWLFSGPFAHPVKPRPVPAGHWIVCGFTRVGRAAAQVLQGHGMQVTVIDPRPDGKGRPPGTIKGDGTRARTLAEAGIEQAAGLVATAGSDADNLSIVMTARELNPELFLAVLEVGHSTHSLYQAAECDLIAQPSVVIAGAILGRISSSLTEPFIDRLVEQDNDFARDLLARLLRHQADRPPEFSAGRISARRSPAIVRALESGREVRVDHFLADPCNHERRLPLEVLLIRRDGEDLLCPPGDTRLQVGDRILIAGRDGAARRVNTTLESDAALEYILTGQRRQHGWIWDWLEQRRQR
ncbi:MAG: potassium channel family protein, partial [Wenzhouxiangellaceae bacterium]